MEDKKFYVYIHYRLDDLQPFYVGKGSGDRVRRSKNRSNYWKNVVAKHGMFYFIVASFEKEEEAFEREIQLISELRAQGYPLVNLTDGGEGISGRRPTEEELNKMRERMKGNKNSVGCSRSEETRKRISESNKGRTFTTTHSEEHKIKIGDSLRGRPQSPEAVAKRIAAVREFHRKKRDNDVKQQG